jgi:GNAT superfamily N-acetyltransferase
MSTLSKVYSIPLGNKKEEFVNHSEILIRPAESADGESLLDLIDALADFEKLPKPDAAARKRLLQDAFGPRKRIDVFLGVLGGRIVAYAIVFETYSSFRALPSLYLEDIFVLSDYRGRQVGHRLFTYCVNEAYRRGCGRMEWAVLDWNRSAIDFYERAGARQLKEWLYYRLVRTDMEKIIQKEN